MTKLGRADDAFRGLLTIMPIGIEEVVPSALRRQSNAYFSSSDAAFSDRYEASENFDRLRESQVGVKAGWRIYSSGPGMYIAQLILNVLGLREHFSDVLLDPVLPRELDGLTFEFEYEGRPVLYTYHVTAQGYSPHRVAVNGTDIEEIRYSENPYRTGGVLISKADFIGRLDRGHNRVEISV